MSRRACPDLANLQCLLDDRADGDTSVDLVAHLETCADCQQTLETLAADPGAWEDVVHGVAKRIRKDPALRDVMERLKMEELPAADADLSFLLPADQPGLLGMLGPYEVEEEIGWGGMGIVLRARDPALRRVVALKVLLPQLAASATARRRFVREGRSAAAVCHEHIVTVYSVNAAGGLPYLVMQYVAGESLQERLDRSGPCAVEEILEIGKQTALGLAAAHAHKLIHRDIKPANILLEGIGRGESGLGQDPPGSSLSLFPTPHSLRLV
jgi:serine/threonine-protein kinase